MTDRKSQQRLLKLEKLISTAGKEYEEREKQHVKNLPYHARRHATEVAAIVLSGRAKIDEPLSIAWARALLLYGIDVYSPEGMEDRVRAERLFPAIIGGAQQSARFTEIFATAPVWLLQFTLTAIDAILLKFQVPDISKRLRWGSDGYKDARSWPLLPSGMMTAGDSIPDNDPRRWCVDILCTVMPGDPIKAFEDRLSRESEEHRSRRDNDPLVADICFALDLDGKPEEEWSGYEKRRMRRLSERFSRLR
jgi:hypothetical protein